MKISRWAILLLMLIGSKVSAGNLMDSQRFVINNLNTTQGYKSTYKISQNYNVLFDADIPEATAKDVIEHTNSQLEDIELTYTISNQDYNSSTEIIKVGQFDKSFAPNRIFIHLGSGFNKGFFVALRVYENTNNPTCFIHLRKAEFILTTPDKQQEIILHELYHCLLWDHQSNNPYINDFDFINQDNNEPLYRLYDKENKRGNINVVINNKTTRTLGFIPRKKKHFTAVFTEGNTVKLIPGKYKIFTDGEYVCKKRKKLAYCNNVRKAKRFNFKKDKTLTLPSVDRTIKE